MHRSITVSRTPFKAADCTWPKTGNAVRQKKNRFIFHHFVLFFGNFSRHLPRWLSCVNEWLCQGQPLDEFNLFFKKITKKKSFCCFAFLYFLPERRCCEFLKKNWQKKKMTTLTRAFFLKKKKNRRAELWILFLVFYTKLRVFYLPIRFGIWWIRGWFDLTDCLGLFFFLSFFLFFLYLSLSLALSLSLFTCLGVVSVTK